jgi:hypothetical protein
MRAAPRLLLAALAGSFGCEVLSSGLPGAAGPDAGERDAPPDRADLPLAFDAVFAIDVGESPGLVGPPAIVGCSDGTREGFRDYGAWRDIAGCAGGFDIPGVVAARKPACGLQAGDTGVLPTGAGCGAADLCAAGWHVCEDATDVKKHSPTGDCEGCVLAGEPRFFLVAAGASAMGICSSDPGATNDLHGCGGLGQPESPECSPLTRRMGFADCLATAGVWACGTAEQNLNEAALVTKTGPTLGGVLCCRD